MKTIHQPEFENEVLKSKVPVLVDFGAAWCQPCRQLEPLLEELCTDWGENAIHLVKVDVGEDSDLTSQIQLFSLPAILLFSEGREVLRLSGLQTRLRLIEKISPFLIKT